MPSKKDKASDNKDLREKLATLKSKFIRYRVVIFIVFVSVVYIYALLQINAANNAQPTNFQIAEYNHTTSTKIPHVDPATVQKMKTLKDNSVNIQAFFDKARNDPFSQ